MPLPEAGPFQIRPSEFCIRNGIQGRDWRAAPSAGRRFPVPHRTVSPFRWPMWGPRQRGHRSAMSLPVFVRNPERIEIIQPRVGPRRTGEELPWVVVQTNHSTLTGLYRFSVISRRRCLRTAHQRPNAGLNDLIPSRYYWSLLRSLPRHSPTPCGVLVYAAGHQRPGQTFRSGHPPALRRRRGRQ